MYANIFLDVCCVLTAKIAPHVKRMVGRVDASPNMIDSFNKTFPDVDARVVDCRYLDRDTSLSPIRSELPRTSAYSGKEGCGSQRSRPGSRRSRMTSARRGLYRQLHSAALCRAETVRWVKTQGSLT
ncbi:hypothetical protein F4818DRAFT_402029 [Hypoxylon cercidicola]|nr:hypothetical protein F4818DRAFT_402029 [Hypoxylon cercidicola]